MSGAPSYKSRNRLTLEEFLSAFLRLQALLLTQSSSAELQSQAYQQADQIGKLLSLSLPSLMATESLSPAQLIQMVAITLYAAQQDRPAKIATELVGSIMNACLVSSCSLPSEELSGFRFLSVVKIALDWFHFRPEMAAKLKRSGNQVWSATARLLNELQLAGQKDTTEADDDGKPLPEDMALNEFSPLSPTAKTATKDRGVPTTRLRDDEVNRIRVARIVQRGKSLASKEGGYLVASPKTKDDEPETVFYAPQLEYSRSPSPPSEENVQPVKEFKILARPAAQRNVALTAILSKQGTTEEVIEPAPPPLKPSPAITHARPSFPSRLERVRNELPKEPEKMHHFGPTGFNTPPLPDTTSLPPPPPVPPPGMGFPLPPPSWSLGGVGAGPPPPVPYSLFNSQTWANQPPGSKGSLLPPPPGAPAQHYLPGMNILEQRPTGGGLFGAPSLWSGPGPSPLERLLEQQKALRGYSPVKQNKPF